LDINQPLPDQQEKTSLASIGIGSSVKLWEHFNSSVDVALPLKTLGTTEQDEWFVSFRVWSEF
jgi:hemolysin activation/secretion protein